MFAVSVRSDCIREFDRLDVYGADDLETQTETDEIIRVGTLAASVIALRTRLIALPFQHAHDLFEVGSHSVPPCSSSSSNLQNCEFKSVFLNPRLSRLLGEDARVTPFSWQIEAMKFCMSASELSCSCMLIAIDYALVSEPEIDVRPSSAESRCHI